ncbi:MAG: M56 family metallopeptidase [Acidimicrobiia bacterium]
MPPPRVPPPIAVAVLLVAIGIRAGSGMLAVRRARRAAVLERWVGAHHRSESHDLVVVATATPIAMSSSVPRAQIILSTGLVESLRQDEVEMVVRHELSLIKGRHHRYLELATVIDNTLGLLPLVRSSTQVLRLGLERWADEEATGPDPAARRALRSALLRTTGLQVMPGYSSLGTPEMLTRRATALTEQPVTNRIRWWHPAVASAAVVTATTAGASSLAVLSVSLTSAGLCYL